MKALMEEYGSLIVAVLIGIALSIVLIYFSINSTGLGESLPIPKENGAGTNSQYVSNKPTLNVIDKFYFKTLSKDSKFSVENFYPYFSAYNFQGEDIKRNVSIVDMDKLDISKEGTKVITFSIKDHGITITRKAVVIFNKHFQTVVGV